MNSSKIKELQDFADDFNKRIDEAVQRYENKKKESLSPIKTTPNSLSPPKKLRLKKRIYSNDIFKEPLPWKEPKHYGRYFDKLKILKIQYDPTPLELYRVNILKRSYEKQQNMLNGNNFVCRNLYSEDFSNPLINNKNLHSLSPIGQSIISRFITENENKENELRKKENDYINYLHTKKSLNINQWKYNGNKNDYFSIFPGSKVNSNIKDIKPKRLINIPFKIPKKTGTFFDKNIKLL